MGDGPRGIEVFEDHFQASTSGEDSMQTPTSSKYIGSNDSLRYIFYRKFEVEKSKFFFLKEFTFFICFIRLLLY